MELGFSWINLLLSILNLVSQLNKCVLNDNIT